MTRSTRVLLAVAGAVAAAVAAAAVWLASIDADAYRGRLEAAVERATGRELTIAGPLSLAIGRPLAIAVEDVTLANAAWGSRPEMVRLERAALDIRLLPLLTGRLRLAAVRVDGLDLLLERHTDGRANWTFGNGEPAGATAGPVVGDEEPATFPTIEEVTLDRIAITYRDGATGTETIVQIDALSLASDDPGGPVDLDLSGMIAGRPLTVSGTTGPAAALGRPGTPFPISLAIDGFGVRASIEGSITRPVAAGGLYAVDGLTLTAGETVVAGRATVARGDDRPRITADLTSQRIRFADFAGAGRAGGGESTPARRGDGRVIPEVPLPFDGLTAVDVELALAADSVVPSGGVDLRQVTVAADLRKGRLAARAGAATADGGRIDTALTATAAERSADLSVTLDGLDLGRTLALSGAGGLIRGGRLDGALGLRGTGETLRRMLTDGRGEVRLVARDAEFRYEGLTLVGADILKQLVDTINPFARRDEGARLGCAVVRGRIAGGVARFERGLALETDRTTVAATGDVRLDTEALDLAVRAQAREGVGVSVAGIAAHFIRIGGTLAEPAITVSPLDAVEGAARAGTDVVTGLIRGRPHELLDLLTGDPSPCRTALGLPPAAASGTPDLGGRAKDLLGGAERGLKGLFGR
jgi:hypothetical protein